MARYHVSVNIETSLPLESPVIIMMRTPASVQRVIAAAASGRAGGGKR